DAVGQRRLAVVDVRDDREVADPFLLHGLLSVAALEPHHAMRFPLLFDVALVAEAAFGSLHPSRTGERRSHSASSGKSSLRSGWKAIMPRAGGARAAPAARARRASGTRGRRRP